MSTFSRRVLSQLAQDHDFMIDPDHGSLEKGPSRACFKGTVPRRSGAGRFAMRALWIGCVAGVLGMVAARPGPAEEVRTAGRYGAIGLTAVAMASAALAWSRTRDRHVLRVAVADGALDAAATGAVVTRLRDGGFAGPAWLVVEHAAPPELHARVRAVDVRCMVLGAQGLTEIAPTSAHAASTQRLERDAPIGLAAPAQPDEDRSIGAA